MKTAMTEPTALKRLALNCVAPRYVAANAGRRYGLPELGVADDSRAVSTMPAIAAIVPEHTRAPVCTAFTRTPARRDTSGSKPTAYEWRPGFVWLRNTASTVIRIST